MTHSPAPLFLSPVDVAALSGTPVVVYRNLKFKDRVVWSVAHASGANLQGKGTLIGYVDHGRQGVAITLTDARMAVSAKRVAHCAANGVREVCAWVAGTVAPRVADTALVGGTKITIRVHSGHPAFVTAAGDDITTADVVTFAAAAVAL